MLFVALFAEGFEEEVLKRIEEIGKVKSLETFSGLILFDFEGNLEMLSKIDFVDDVLLLIKKFQDINRYTSTLFKIKKQISKLNFMKPLFVIRKIRKTEEKIRFDVSSGYKGRRDYTAKEVRNVVKKAILKNTTWELDEIKPELHFQVLLTEEFSFCGISLNSSPVHVRERLITVPGSIKSSIANMLVYLSGLKESEIFLDPMCGAGTIAISAKKITSKVFAGDKDPEVLVVARKNCPDINFKIWDARKVDIKTGEINKVVCNLPFDKQVPLEDGFFELFIEEMRRISKKGARWVFLTKQQDEFEKFCLEKSLHLFRKDIINSGLKSTVLVIDI